MNEAAQAQGLVHPSLHRRLSQDEALFHVPLRVADSKRSVENILLWNSHLSTACVRTMVRMGWDYAT
jgi:hypothetical protein